MSGMIALAAISLLAPLSNAQDEPGDQAPPPAKRAGFRAASGGRSQVDVQQIRQTMRERETKELEELRSSNPEAYEERKRMMDRRDRIERILSDARDNKLSPEEAESKLFPLMKEALKPDLDAMDGQIESLEQRLAALKKAKKDPDSFVRERIEEMLGKRPQRPAGRTGTRP